MYMDQAQSQIPQTSTNISAKLIASIKILQYSAEELEQTISNEVTENPALDVDKVEQCLRCGSVLHGGTCVSCDRPHTGDGDHFQESASWDDGNYRNADLSLPESLEFDPLDFVKSAATLEDHLMRQMAAVVHERDLPIAEFLVGNLNPHGFLGVSDAQVAETLRVPERRVQDVVSILQSLDPPGIGARDLRECLLIQLRYFEETGEAPPIARALLDHYLQALGEHHFAEIARETHSTMTQVKQAWRFVRTNLNPYPAHAFATADTPESSVTGSADSSVLVRPDVVIRKTESGFEAEVVEARRFKLQLNPEYAALLRQSRANASAGSSELSESERLHIRQYAGRARFFIDCIRQRWATLQMISDALIVCQHDFLEHGIRHLLPLTRGELANRVGLHESTVSRATTNKYVLLPSGRTIPFDDFFDGSLAAKDRLKDYISSEDRANPLSDDELADLLTRDGMPLARRTVAKYREALRILPSRLRF